MSQQVRWAGTLGSQAKPQSRKQSARAAVSARVASAAAAAAAPARVLMEPLTTSNQVVSNATAFKLANGVAWLLSGLILERVSTTSTGKSVATLPVFSVSFSTTRPWPQAVSVHLQNSGEREESKQGMELIHAPSPGSLEKAAAKSGWLQNLTKPPTRGYEAQGDLAPREVQAMGLSAPEGRLGKSLDCHVSVNTSME
jgi:hypothetical protein